jgi:hypothetical protein
VRFLHADTGRSKIVTVGELAKPDRDESLNPVDHAAMTVVCLTLLNLDEAMTRE